MVGWRVFAARFAPITFLPSGFGWGARRSAFSACSRGGGRGGGTRRGRARAAPGGRGKGGVFFAPPPAGAAARPGVSRRGRGRRGNGGGFSPRRGGGHKSAHGVLGATADPPRVDFAGMEEPTADGEHNGR